MFDTFTKQKSIEDLYEYDREGIRQLLKNYHKLKEEGTYSYDAMAVIIRMDLERSLHSKLLQSNHLCVLGLHYALQLSFMEVQLYAGIPIEEAMDAEEEAVQILLEVLDGAPTTFYEYEELMPARTLTDYVCSVSAGAVSPFNITDALLTDLLNITKHKDKLANEVLNQRKEGRQTNFSMDEGYESLEDEYPFHETAAYIESPGSRQGKNTSYDYFRNQDKKNQVTYDDFVNQAKGVRVNGRKKVTTSSELLGNRGMVYQL